MKLFKIKQEATLFNIEKNKKKIKNSKNNQEN